METELFYTFRGNIQFERESRLRDQKTETERRTEGMACKQIRNRIFF